MKKITICGSMFFLDQMRQLGDVLERAGFEVFVPMSLQEMGLIDYSHYTDEEGAELKIKHDLINMHYEKIVQSEAILVVNHTKKGINNYIGGNTLMEMAFAHVLNRDVFIVNPPPDLGYKAEINATLPTIVGENMSLISKHFENLPKVYISSESPLKIDATSFAFRKIGMKFDVKGLKTNSRVSEQPLSIEETTTGALNRLEDLKSKIVGESYRYIVSIESGLTRLDSTDNYYGVTVCIVEDLNGKQQKSIVTDLIIPKEMTDLIPNKYPDLGVLVQKEYNSRYKDPFQHFTNGLINRRDLLQNSVFYAVALFQK